MKVNRRFGGTYRLHLQGLARKRHEAGSKKTFTELRGVISRKTEPFSVQHNACRVK
jgi:hypothetical protein